MLSLLSVVFLASFTSASDCNLFRVGDCHGNLVDTKTLNCDDSDLCITLCQADCKVSEGLGCNFFSYEDTTKTCRMMSEATENEFLSTCDTIAGPANPSIAECATSPPDTCDRFIGVDCVSTGASVHAQSGVASAEACQEYLKEIGEIVGATFFVYDASDNGLCDLRDSSIMTCDAVAGPDEPKFTNC